MVIVVRVESDFDYLNGIPHLKSIISKFFFEVFYLSKQLYYFMY